MTETSSVELVISSPTEKQYPSEIKFNYVELKTWLADSLEKYKNLHYTEQQLGMAKKDRANLNRLKDNLKNKRIEIKKLCLTPFEDFNLKIDELLKMVDEPVQAIDTQVKSYENTKKAEKRARLEAFFKGEAKELAEIVPFERIFNERWLNATFDEDNANTEIFNAIGKIRKDLETLEQSVETKFKVEIKSVYLNTLDLGEALRRNEQLKAEQKKQEEYAAAQAAKKAPAPAPQPAAPIVEPEVLQAPPVGPVQTFAPGGVQPAQEEAQPIDIRVWVNPAQKAALKQFLADNGIRCGKVQ